MTLQTDEDKSCHNEKNEKIDKGYQASVATNSMIFGYFGGYIIGGD